MDICRRADKLMHTYYLFDLMLVEVPTCRQIFDYDNMMEIRRRADKFMETYILF